MADLACDPPGQGVRCHARDETGAQDGNPAESHCHTDLFRAAIILFRCAAQLRVLLDESGEASPVIDNDRQLIEIMAHHYSARVGVPKPAPVEEDTLPPSNLDVRE